MERQPGEMRFTIVALVSAPVNDDDQDQEEDNHAGGNDS